MTNETQSRAAGQDQPRRLIYLVDDEPMVLELTRLVLAPHGYDLAVFRDAEQALEAFTKADRKPDLVLTDYAMEKMNGMELMQACRRVRPEQKVMLFSGTVTREICSTVTPGPDAFLEKPFRIKELVEIVRRLTR